MKREGRKRRREEKRRRISTTTMTSSNAVISPTIHNEVIVGRRDLQKINIIPKQFPKPIMVMTSDQFEKYKILKTNLTNLNPDVLTDDLPLDSMEGCVMKIHVTPGDKKPFRISTARVVRIAQW